MEPKLLATATKIMDELFEHPITRTFQEPVPIGEDAPANYFEIIKNPIDLGTIKTKLSEGKYSTLQEWLDDVELVWKNAETYNEPGTAIVINVSECRRIFKKLCRDESAALLNTWCAEAYRLKSKIAEIISKAPHGKIKTVVQNANNSNKQQKNSMTLFSESEMINFVKASEMLQDEDHQREIIRIIDANQPEIDNMNEHLNIDITKLNLPTMHAIQDYMKSAIEHSGRKYPE